VAGSSAQAQRGGTYMEVDVCCVGSRKGRGGGRDELPLRALDDAPQLGKHAMLHQRDVGALVRPARHELQVLRSTSHQHVTHRKYCRSAQATERN